MYKKTSERVIAVVLAVNLFLLSAATLNPVLVSAASQPRDPWYQDVKPWHWFYRYIRTLWEVEVTDGWQFYDLDPQQQTPHLRAVFRPGESIKHGAFLLMMAKVFRLKPLQEATPSFQDVNPDYTLYNGKPAFGYLEAAHQAGLVPPSTDGRLHPEQTLHRYQAITILLQSLNLVSYAHSLTEDKIQDLLGRFRDADLVPQSARPLLAAAVNLRIIQGYPDRTLRPHWNLSRSEAAAIIYRSCLVLVDAEPVRFSPDGDGIADTTTFTIKTLNNRNVSRWNLYVSSYSMGQFRRFTASREGDPGPPPVTIEWDGTDNYGHTLPAGTYYYRAWVEDRNGHPFYSVLKPIYIVEKDVRGKIEPATGRPGDRLVLTAYTTGGALSVEAHFPDQTLSMEQVEKEQDPVQPESKWELTYRIPPTAQPGPREVKLIARYEATTRTTVVPYSVTSDFWVVAHASPNPARAGEKVVLVATTAASVDRTRGRLWFGEDFSMLRTGRNHWRSTFTVPPDTPDGTYTIEVTAYEGSKKKKATLTLTVQGTLYDDLLFLLTE